MESIPQNLLDAYGAATDELGSWNVLADWVHEREPVPSVVTAPKGARFWADDRRGLTHRGFLRWEGTTGPARDAFTPVLNAPCALIDELRVAADWHTPRHLFLGAVARGHDLAQHLVLPAVLEAVLAAVPVTLRRLAVWLPNTPLWRPQDDCLTQLAPLAQARPPRARHLTLRAPRVGLLRLLERVVEHRWTSIRLCAALDADEARALDALAAARPDTTFVRYGVSEPTPHVRALADPDEWELVVQGTPHAIVPGRLLLASPLEAALGEFDLQLNHQLGLLALERASTPRRGTVTVDGAPLAGLRRLKPGPLRLRWEPQEGRALEGLAELRRPARR